MQKTNFINHFFLEILHFKESCNLIGWQHWELQLSLIWDWWWLFPRKTEDKIFLKIQKEPILALFYPNLGKNEFSWKKELSDFRYSNYLPLCQKFLRKKLNENWRTDRLTDRQRWFYRTLRKIGVQKSLAKVWLIHAELMSHLYNFIILRKNNTHSWR